MSFKKLGLIGLLALGSGCKQPMKDDSLKAYAHFIKDAALHDGNLRPNEA